MLAKTDTDGRKTSYDYDFFGRLIEEAHEVPIKIPNAVAYEYTTHFHDDCGHELWTVNRGWAQITRTFDVFGRVGREEHFDAGPIRDIRRSFDSLGRETASSDSAYGTTRTTAYEESGEVAVTVEGPGGVVNTTSDGTGRPRGVTATLAGRACGWSVTGTDTAGRVTSWSSLASTRTGTVHYDEAGRVDSERSGAFEATYSFDPTTGRKHTDRFSLSFAGRSEATTYTYGVDGRLTGEERDGASSSYDHDPLTGAMRSYRRSGAPTVSLTYVNGRLRSAGTRRYGYDLSGRRDSECESGLPTDTVYTWSGERLTTWESSTATLTHRYDGSGQRVRTVSATGPQSTTTTWTYEGLRLNRLAATRSDGATWGIDYLFDERGRPCQGVYSASDASTTPFVLVTTDRGDVRELIDEDGSAFGSYAYDAFGLPVAQESMSTTRVTSTVAEAITERQVLRYAGYAWDAASGLYYCSQRYYDPETMQFISKDPARADGEESAYQYCGGDPVGKVDPSGEIALWITATRLLLSRRALSPHMSNSRTTCRTMRQYF